MIRYIFRIMGAPHLSTMTAAGDLQKCHLSRSTLALLALLTMNGRGASLSRERVSDALWPDAPPDKAASRLSSALFRLRAALGPAGSAVEAIEGRVGLASPCPLEVDVFDVADRTRSLESTSPATWERRDVGLLEAAINQRSGIFLDGLDGDWVLAARQRCAEIYEAGLEALIRYHRQSGDIGRSIEAARALVRQDPYREDIQAVLVDLYARRGQKRRAMAQFEAAREVLGCELGVEPGPVLVRSAEAALAGGDHLAIERDILAALRSFDLAIGRLVLQVDKIHSMLGHRP